MACELLAKSELSTTTSSYASECGFPHQVPLSVRSYPTLQRTKVQFPDVVRNALRFLDFINQAVNFNFFEAVHELS